MAIQNPVTMSTVDSSGNSVPIESTGGAVPVTTGGPAALAEKRTALFNAAGDLPTDETSINTAELITLNGFTAGLKRCRVTFNSAAAGTSIPFAGAVGAVVNGSAAAAATELSITDVSEGDTGAVDNGPRMVSQSSPVIEYELTADVTTVYLVGYAPGGTGAAIVRVSVEVW